MSFRCVVFLLSLLPLAVLAYSKFIPDARPAQGTPLLRQEAGEGGISAITSGASGDIASARAAALQMIAEGLEVPWDLSFLPNGDLLVSERGGRLVRISPDGARRYFEVPGVSPHGEGGLLGMVLHPLFSENFLLFLYQTYKDVRGWENRIVRYRFINGRLTEESVLLDGIPAARYHNGGRMAWGPDGKLYVTTGDAGNPKSAQDLGSLGGKILRLNADGTIPDDNPFPGSPVYSYGHRNPQGLAWDSEGRLWSTEHGPSGPLLCCRDELNLIVPGGNYGWPEIMGGEEKEGMLPPVLHSGQDTTWAPGSLAFWRGRLWFGGLRGEALYEVQEATGTPRVVRHLGKLLGRVRTVKAGPDEALYLLTSNRDGRGAPRQGDDKVIRLAPELVLEQSP